METFGPPVQRKKPGMVCRICLCLDGGVLAARCVTGPLRALIGRCRVRENTRNLASRFKIDSVLRPRRGTVER